MSLNIAAKYFVRNDVKNILKKISGFDLNKIYSFKYNQELKSSEIQLLTNKELNLERKNCNEKAKNFLQMPPLLPPREIATEILSSDKNLDPLNLTNSNYQFIDISLEIPHDKRMIVVREKDGLLRKADSNEREKILQVYFPLNRKSKNMSEMFKTNNLEECLNKKHYILILKKACIEFEPNDPEFIRISQKVYEHVNDLNDFDYLYSTRFFGSMSFYLIWYKKIENLMVYFLQKKRIDDCCDLIHLFYIIHNIKLSENFSDNQSQHEKIKIFINNELKKSTKIENALLKIDTLS